jgi:hypothetical protein
MLLELTGRGSPGRRPGAAEIAFAITRPMGGQQGFSIVVDAASRTHPAWFCFLAQRHEEHRALSFGVWGEEVDHIIIVEG